MKIAIHSTWSILALNVILLLLTPDLVSADSFFAVRVDSFPEGSQLNQLVGGKLVNLYLVEYQGNRFFAPDSPSGGINNQIRLKELAEFKQSPPKNNYAKITFYGNIAGAIARHNFEIYNWDGQLAFVNKVEALNGGQEVVYHNSFIYLKNARAARNAGDFALAKYYIERIPILDPKSGEAQQSAEMDSQLKVEQARKEAQILMTQAETARNAGRLQEALSLYKDAAMRYGQLEEIVRVGTAGAFTQALAEEAEKAHQAQISASEEQKVLEGRIQVEKVERARQEDQKKAEASAKARAVNEKEKANRAEEFQINLNKARIARQGGRFQDAADVLQDVLEKDAGNAEAASELSQLNRAWAADLFEKAQKSRREKQWAKAFESLRKARGLDNQNIEIRKELDSLKDDIPPEAISNMDMAFMMFNPSDDMRFIMAPPADPDSEAGTVFIWGGVLDQKVDDYYIVKLAHKYKFCFTGSVSLKGVNFHSSVRVVGIYLGNVEFTTVLGAPDVVACLRALYVE